VDVLCLLFPAWHRGLLDDATGTAPPAAGIEVTAMLFCSAVVMGAAGDAVPQGEGNTGIRVIGREIMSGDIVVVMGMLDDATGAVGGAVSQGEGNTGIWPWVIGRETVWGDIVCDADAAAISGWSIIPGMVTGPLGNVGAAVGHVIGCSMRWNIHALALITLEPSKLGHAYLIDVEHLLVAHGIAEVRHEVINLLDILVSFGILNMSKYQPAAL
jgi:hypothetical protein